MFYHPREFFVPQEYRTRIFSQILGNAPALLIDGIAAGTWAKTKKKAEIEIMVRPFKALSSIQKRAIEGEAGRLQEFFGTNIKVHFDVSLTLPLSPRNPETGTTSSLPNTHEES